MIDRNLADQLLAEIREARGQMQEAEYLIQMHRDTGRFSSDPRGAWLAWHKCQEAETNLHNVAVALEKGAGKQ